MVMTSLFLSGIGMFLTGFTLTSFSCPPSEKRQIDKMYKALELQRKKERLMPMRNADINLFGLLRD